MLRRIWSNISTKAGVGVGGGGGGAMSNTCVRHMSRKRAENLQRINPKVPYRVATSIAQDLFNLFNQRGPLTYGATWTSIQEAGLSGLNSKTHMKLMIKWMRGKKMISQICQQVGSNKKFLLCTPGTSVPSAVVQVKTAKKSSQKKKKKPKKK